VVCLRSDRIVTSHIELLCWQGCESHPAALRMVQDAVAQLGLVDVSVTARYIDTHEEAVAERFVGSPTIRIDGVDIVAPSDSDQYGLTCRLYRLRDGRYSPTPDLLDLTDALRSMSGSRSSHR
jgi:hypothetical protein